MSRKNILFWYWGRKGGGANYSASIFEKLTECSSLSIVPSFSKLSDFYTHKYSEGINFNINTYSNPFVFLIKTFFLPVLVVRFLYFIKSNKIAVVICPMSHIWNVAFIPFFKLLSIEYILVAHDGVPHPGDDIFLRSLLLKIEITLSDKIIVLTKAVKEVLQEKYKLSSKIYIIPHGYFKYGQQGKRKYPRKTFTLVFFGRILNYKGLNFLVKSFSSIDNIFNLKLKIYGHGQIDKRTLSIINNHNNIDLYNNWISESKIGAIMDQADLIVLPYIEASQSGVIPIALSSGVPILASSVGGLSEQLNHGALGVLFKAQNQIDFLDKLRLIYFNEKLYEILSENGHEFCQKNLSWESIAKKFEQVIRG